MDQNQQSNPQVPQELSPEEKQIEKAKLRSGKHFTKSPKFQEWYRLFTNKSNKETFGNATQSTIQAYNLDPESQYGVARQMGSENLAKLDNAFGEILAKKGVTFGSMVDIGFNKMLKSNSFDSWLMFLEMLGAPVPNFKPISSPTVYMNQVNNNIEGGVTVYGQLTDEQLDAIIESKRRKAGVNSIARGEGEADIIESVEVHETPPEAISVSTIGQTDTESILG